MCLEAAGSEQATLVSGHGAFSTTGVQSCQSPYFYIQMKWVSKLYQALYRKYRPRAFDDVVGQEHITETLKNQVRGDKLSHAYLFIGTRGTGKTTCAKILAKAVNCEHPVNGNPCNECPSCRGIDDGTIMDVVELDAASNNGVDNVRALRDEAIFTPAGAKKRVYIIDEVHMLSTAAFNALLKIMEEPPAHLMFILATTELKKVPATILSRCQKYSFKRIDSTVVANRLLYVAEQEHLHLERDAAELLGRLADGSMRDGLSLLDQVLGDGNITVESVLSCTGLVGSLQTVQLLEYVAQGDAGNALALFGKLWQDGKDPAMLLDELSDLLRDVLLFRAAPRTCGQLLSGNYDTQALGRFVDLLSPSTLLADLETVQNAQDKLRDSSNARMVVELCLIGLCDPTLSDSLAGLRARIEQLERQIAEGGVPAGGRGTADAAPVMRGQTEPRTAVPRVEQRPSYAPPVSRQEQDLPPWETPAPSYEPEEERPPLPEEPPMPEKRYQESYAVRRTPEKQAGAQDDRWQAFLSASRGILGPGPSGLLYQCSATFEPDSMTIAAPDFPYMQLSSQTNLQKLKACGEQVYGKPVRVELINQEVDAPRATRSLDELKKFDIVKLQ